MQKKIKFIDISDQTKKSGYYSKPQVINDLKNKSYIKFLLMPLNRMPQKPLLEWTNDLRSRIQSIYSQKMNVISATEIAEIFDESIRIFISTNQLKYAREICYSQIQILIGICEKFKKPQCLKHVFQPWIHLIRMDRMEGNFSDAFYKLNILSKMNSSQMMINENKLSTKLLLEVFNHNQEVHDNVMTQILFERIQLYIDRNNYTGLLRFIHSQKNKVSLSAEMLLQEAAVIAHINLNQFESALELLSAVRVKAGSIIKNIFTLRECEVRIKKDKNIINELQQCSKDLLPFFRRNKTRVDAILIGLYLADVLQLNGKLEEAVKLLYYCLETSHYISDDILKTECLIKLYQLISEPEGKNIIENIMIDHYYHTQYFMMRKKLLDFFSDLRYVEYKYHHDDTTTLFEDLLIFSSSYK